MILGGLSVLCCSCAFLGTVSEHTMLLEGVCSRPAPTGNSAPVTGVEIMRKLSKSHAHSESALRIKVCVGLNVYDKEIKSVQLHDFFFF